ncbi:hypothetical protein CRUP_016937, partial [Coryphaenoides rupestris]
PTARPGVTPFLFFPVATFLLGIRPVTHLYLSDVTWDSAAAAWNAPAPPADLFILSYASADGMDTSKVTLEGTRTRSLVQDLLPSTRYTVSLITIQGDATSEPVTAPITTGESQQANPANARVRMTRGLLIAGVLRK